MPGRLTRYGMLMAAILGSTAVVLAAQGPVAAAQQEYRLKAVIIYNIIKFVDGLQFDDPNQDQGPQKGSIVIGIVGDDPFKDAFDPLLDKPIGDRHMVLRRLAPGQGPTSDPNAVDPNRVAALRQCNVLFVCPSERQRLPGILSVVQGLPILTVGDVPGFLEQGGVINLGIENNKIYFEVNLAAASRARLNLRSQLLRLAKRIIRKDNRPD